MKKYALVLMLGGLSLGMVACGGEEASADETNATTETHDANNGLNEAIQDGVNEAINEVTEQLADSTSQLNEMVDTLKEVLEDNKEVIEEKVEEGLDALNKSF